jgi:Na+-transporting methylmalonyl-CoA/oxaloacetate decarboxylase gamma subunit
MNDFLVAMEIYFMGFVIAVIMAALIKGMLALIRRFSPAEKAVAEKGEEGNA